MKFETHRPKAYLLCHPVAGIVVFSNDPIRGVSRQPDFDPGLNLRRDSVCGVRRSAARTRGVHVIGVLAQKFDLKVARHFFAPPCGPFIELGQIVPCAPGLPSTSGFDCGFGGAATQGPAISGSGIGRQTRSGADPRHAIETRLLSEPASAPAPALALALALACASGSG